MCCRIRNESTMNHARKSSSAQWRQQSRESLSLVRSFQTRAWIATKGVKFFIIPHSLFLFYTHTHLHTQSKMKQISVEWLARYYFLWFFYNSLNLLNLFIIIIISRWVVIIEWQHFLALIMMNMVNFSYQFESNYTYTQTSVRNTLSQWADKKRFSFIIVSYYYRGNKYIFFAQKNFKWTPPSKKEW